MTYLLQSLALAAYAVLSLYALEWLVRTLRAKELYKSTK
jgi:hypothetical protein